eukprot:CAMPEP_0204888352 /NCGR_PEP_ID=MMETSP1349-20130617/20068_1 /ASSEMBLY_ACC=CAM_ASM_000710 /TAXON_ID=215587 /ORGANISM="Aplanochytrium stocchinoi, Strain GSBS06" /LENGTH=183 /DNA_ID=CAMNT_0052051733 /DNA_START=102 /DNA_END=650 /DNA_ORIENTATION=+
MLNQFNLRFVKVLPVLLLLLNSSIASFRSQPSISASGSVRSLIDENEDGKCADFDKSGLRDVPISASAVVYIDGLWNLSSAPRSSTLASAETRNALFDVANDYSDSSEGTRIPEKSSSIKYQFQACIPGDLISDLERVGLIKNPLFENEFKNRKAEQLWNDMDWLYTKSFAVDKSKRLLSAHS